ncbi:MULTISPECIES: hypothetical protein [unclassified Rhodococcus (in: high G+C Gram-positive bacteria)]|uniref:hypothetical protein n=1 Tax=unclassified Rhodococcus (in: high G+C Gram-positive bacteria) TaxID=192944 RepID=UPI0032D5A748
MKRGNRFDFDKLVRVAEYSNAEQCARHVVVAKGALTTAIVAPASSSGQAPAVNTSLDGYWILAAYV